MAVDGPANSVHPFKLDTAPRARPPLPSLNRSGQPRHNAQPDHRVGRQLLSSIAPRARLASQHAGILPGCRRSNLALHGHRPADRKRRRTTYRLTMEEARARYVDPEPVPNSLEVREVSEQRGHGHVLGAKTKG